jgi:general secretion pathway protein K
MIQADSRKFPIRANLRPAAQRGVALIITLWVVMILSMLVAGFAFTMHVETRVAAAQRLALKADALARSGFTVASRILKEGDGTAETSKRLVAFNQPWHTNVVMLVDHKLGEGSYTVSIRDEESKMPVNRADDKQLRRLIDEIGLSTVLGEIDGDVIVDSILDWIDDNDLHRLNGAEDEYYRSLARPYRPKNGPLDRVEELLSIRGVTTEAFYGQPQTETTEAQPGLRDLLTAYSMGRVNVNTASRGVLKAWIGLDDAATDAIISRRAGPDGEEGTEDDLPFQQVVGALELVPALDVNLRRQLSQILTVESRFFTITSTGDVQGVKRTIVALVEITRQGVSVVSWQELQH